MLGKTQYDQDYIDGNVEAGIGGCGWARPAARPSELDAGGKVVKPVAKKKRRGIVARLRSHLKRTPAAPAPSVAPPTPPIVVEPPPAPPPRDPVYDLLGVYGRPSR